MELADCFQPSYRISRQRLLEGAHRLAPRHGTLVDSRALALRGPAGETLALDFAIFGARRPRHVLVVSSGTHGVEGYTGSALQHWMLDALLPRLALGPDTAIVLQHANNPWGFAWHHRVNEGNVDFNRNFVERYEPTCHPDYEALYEEMNPPDLDPVRDAERLARLDGFIAEHGFRRFQQAFSEGQYKHPSGVQFGGNALQPGAAHLLALVREHLSAAQNVLWIDVHTGLGAFGACELITGAPPDSDRFALATEVWQGAAVSASGGDSVSPPLNGMLEQGIARALPAGCRHAVVSPEFGTYAPRRVILALRADNWRRHHPGPAADAAAAAQEAEMLEVFRPADRGWRATVVATGARFVEQAVDWLPGVRRR